MTLKKSAYLLIAKFYLFNLFSFSQENKQKIRMRIYAGPLVNRYSNHPYYTNNTRALYAFSIGTKAEIKFIGNSSILSGIEYVNHGVRFNSYYFAPGHSKIFDKNLAYSHRFRIHEAQMPFIFKNSLTDESKVSLSPYLLGGFGFRYIFLSTTNISYDKTGQVLYEGKSKTEFEHHLITPHLNAILLGGIGLQKNIRTSGSGLFAEMIFKYMISRFVYTGNGSSNNHPIKDISFFISMGYKI